MDSKHKSTLAIIVAAVGTLSVADRGKQLLHVARDYAEDGDILYARTVLSKIDSEYFEKYLSNQVLTDSLLADSLAVLIGIFGVDLQFTLKPADTT